MTLAAHDDHPIVFHLRLVAGQLAADPRRPLPIPPMHRAARSDQQRRVVVHDVRRIKAVGVFLGDQICAQPALDETRMFDKSAPEKLMLCDTPRM